MKYTVVIFSLLFLFSCKEDKPSNIQVTQRKYDVPAFDADSAFSFVADQLSFGPRVPGSEGHEKCANYLAGKLKSYGLNGKLESFSATRFDGQPINGKNVVGSLNPQAKKRVFICAHWDSRFMADYDQEKKDAPILGADDGASGVAVALEVARVLSQSPDFKMGLDVVFFDAEDQGDDEGETDSWGIGAQRWSNKHKANYNPKFGILLDMVGAEDATFFRERFSMQTAPNLVYKIWKTAEQLGYGHVFINQDGRGVVDDHYFIHQNTGWATVDIIHTKNGGNTGFGAHWHTHGDDLSVIDRKMLRTVGRVVLNVLCKEDTGQF